MKAENSRKKENMANARSETGACIVVVSATPVIENAYGTSSLYKLSDQKKQQLQAVNMLNILCYRLRTMKEAK